MSTKSYAGQPIVLTKKQIDNLIELNNGFFTEASPSVIQTIKDLNAQLIAQIIEHYQKDNIDSDALMFLTISPVLSFTTETHNG